MVQTQVLPRWKSIVLLFSLAGVFAACHILARIALDHGTSVAAAIAVRSTTMAAASFVLLHFSRTGISVTRVSLKWSVLLGVLLAGQSALLYSAIARMPVPLAVFTFNVFPILYTLFNWAAGGKRPALGQIVFMAIALVGLALALNVGGSESSLQDGLIGGIAFSLGAAALFSLVILVTDRKLRSMDGRKRSFYAMSTVASLVWILGYSHLQGLSIDLPRDSIGWLGLLLLSLLFGGAMITLLVWIPKLDMARNGVASNLEPIATLGLAWLFLEQAISSVQLIGAMIVVGAVIGLGVFRKA